MLKHRRKLYQLLVERFLDGIFNVLDCMAGFGFTLLGFAFGFIFRIALPSRFLAVAFALSSVLITASFNSGLLSYTLELSSWQIICQEKEPELRKKMELNES
jgi:hypothetical protein